MPPRVNRTGPDTLDQWAKESPTWHRGLLLWAMQGENTSPGGFMGRSISLVSRIVGRSQPSVRDWSLECRWAQRLAAHGAEGTAYAVELYRLLYLDMYGKADIPQVQHLVPLDLPTLWRKTDLQEEVEVRLRRTLMPPPPTGEVQQQVVKEVEEAKSEQLKNNYSLQAVSQEAILALSAAIRKGEVKPRVSDLKMLHDLLTQLEQEARRLEHPEMAPSDSLAVTDSVRVKIAKATGGNILLAYYEDLQEAQVLLESILGHDAAEQVGAEVNSTAIFG